MKDIKVVRQALHDLKVEGRTLIDAIKAKDRLPTASEDAKLTGLEADIEKAAVIVAQVEAEMDEQRKWPIVGSLSDPGHPFGRPSQGAINRANGGHRYADMFAGANFVPNNVGTLDEFLSVINEGVHHPGLIQATATGMGQEIGGEGGYLIPSEHVAQMLDASLENEVVRGRADVQRMTSNEKKISGWDTENHTGGTIGGFSGQWISEGTSATVDTGTTRKITLQAKKLMVYTSASNELVSDGTTFEQQLSDAMVAGIGWHLDDAYLNGTGAGQPKGVLTDPALITVAKESSQVADTIVYENLTKMFARLHPASLRNAVWVANSDTIPQLLNLQIKIQNVAASENVGGSHVPALREDGSGGFTLLTRPVIFTEKVATVGDLGDIMLADFSQYSVGLRPEMGIQKSIHAGFQKDESHFRIIIRTDGMGRWSGPVTPKTGSTLSWCVTLAARA